MKAEHRKELETNVLADRMGRLVTQIKHRPQRRTVLWVILGVVVVLVLGFLFLLRRGHQIEMMEQWRALDVGNIYQIGGVKEVKRDDAIVAQITGEVDSNAGKAARFQLARHYLWDKGVRQIGLDSRAALDNITFAEKLYLSLVKESQGEKEFMAEAEYGLAVIEETRALLNQDRLATAEQMFDKVATSYKDSSFAILAETRAKQLKDNQESIRKLYRELQTRFNLSEAKKDRLPLAHP